MSSKDIKNYVSEIMTYDELLDIDVIVRERTFKFMRHKMLCYIQRIIHTNPALSKFLEDKTLSLDHKTDMLSVNTPCINFKVTNVKKNLEICFSIIIPNDIPGNRVMREPGSVILNQHTMYEGNPIVQQIIINSLPFRIEIDEFLSKTFELSESYRLPCFLQKKFLRDKLSSQDDGYSSLIDGIIKICESINL
jgi:hypothetical protein